MSLKTLQQHTKRYRELRVQLYQKIKEEFERGSSISEIANAVGLSRQRVHQIVQAQNLKEESTTNGKST